MLFALLQEHGLSMMKVAQKIYGYFRSEGVAGIFC